MYPNTQTPAPCDGDPCDCKKSVAIGSAGSGTTIVKIKRDTFSADITSSECIRLPLKSGGALSLAWNRLSGQGASESDYSGDGWKPAGSGSVFSFLPRVNVLSPSPKSLPDLDEK